MKKLLFVSALAFFAFTSASAQSKESSMEGFKIGGGIDVLFPVSNAKNVSVGAGIDILAQYGITENIVITADAGYTSLMIKKDYRFGDVKSQGLIPLRAGLRFYPSSQFYVGAKAGVGILSNAVKSYTIDANLNLVPVKGSVTYTAYSVGAGYMLSPKLDIGINYDGYSKNGSFGLLGARIGYTFGN